MYMSHGDPAAYLPTFPPTTYLRSRETGVEQIFIERHSPFSIETIQFITAHLHGRFDKAKSHSVAKS